MVSIPLVKRTLYSFLCPVLLKSRNNGVMSKVVEKEKLNSQLYYALATVSVCLLDYIFVPGCILLSSGEGAYVTRRKGVSCIGEM